MVAVACGISALAGCETGFEDGAAAFRRQDKTSETGKAVRYHGSGAVNPPFKFDIMSSYGEVFYDVEVPKGNQNGLKDDDGIPTEESPNWYDIYVSCKWSPESATNADDGFYVDRIALRRAKLGESGR